MPVCKYCACTNLSQLGSQNVHSTFPTRNKGLINAYLSGMSIPRRNISPRNSSLLLQTGHRKKYRPALQACCYGNNTDTSRLFTLSSLDHISSVSPVPTPLPGPHTPGPPPHPSRPIPSFQFIDGKLQRPWKEMEEASLSSKVVSLYNSPGGSLGARRSSRLDSTVRANLVHI